MHKCKNTHKLAKLLGLLYCVICNKYVKVRNVKHMKVGFYLNQCVECDGIVFSDIDEE